MGGTLRIVSHRACVRYTAVLEWVLVCVVVPSMLDATPHLLGGWVGVGASTGVTEQKDDTTPRPKTRDRQDVRETTPQVTTLSQKHARSAPAKQHPYTTVSTVHACTSASLPPSVTQKKSCLPTYG